jgi:hypothetical protein
MSSESKLKLDAFPAYLIFGRSLHFIVALGNRSDLIIQLTTQEFLSCASDAGKDLRLIQSGPAAAAG